MVMRSLSIAATGMNAQQTNLDVIANNIANVNTTGYKRARAEFADLMYTAERMVGVPNAGADTMVPEGAMIGLGVRTAAVRRTHDLQGSYVETGNQLNVLIEGRGYFEIQDANGNTFYTRAGAFNLNADGQLVTLDGNLVQPVITVPDQIGKDGKITITRDGRVLYRLDGDAEQTELGQLNLINFTNQSGLEPVGDNLFRETAASGAPIVGNPGDENYGVLHQGYLEASNVDPVREITDLIAAQRAYEMNSKVIQTADEMSAVVSKNLR